MSIPKNISTFERILRVIVGLYVMLFGLLFLQGVLGTLLGVVGAVAFLTGAVGYCGFYTLLGKPVSCPAPVPTPEEAAAEAVEAG